MVSLTSANDVIANLDKTASSSTVIVPTKVSQVLVCRPTHFSVDYIINPHMQPNSINKDKATRQWSALVKTLESLEIKVDVIEQPKGVPDMVFATDQGIVRDDAIVLANFRYPQRKAEQIYYKEWFRNHGFRLSTLPKDCLFEGGDTVFFDHTLLVGTGFRACVESCEELAQMLEIDAVPLDLVDPYFYHLDMCFLAINDNTAFYYPPAFSPASQSLLQSLVPSLIELSSGAAKSYAANSFVSGKDILISSDTPASFQESLRELDLRIHELNISEFKKAGGGIHCLINVLG